MRREAQGARHCSLSKGMQRTLPAPTCSKWSNTIWIEQTHTSRLLCVQQLRPRPKCSSSRECLLRMRRLFVALTLCSRSASSTSSRKVRFHGKSSLASLIADFPPAFLKFDTYETIHMNDSRRANHSDRYLVLYLDGG